MKCWLHERYDGDALPHSLPQALTPLVRNHTDNADGEADRRRAVGVADGLTGEHPDVARPQQAHLGPLSKQHALRPRVIRPDRHFQSQDILCPVLAFLRWDCAKKELGWKIQRTVQLTGALISNRSAKPGDWRKPQEYHIFAQFLSVSSLSELVSDSHPEAQTPIDH
ncbi:hypothetical protein EYF80_037105 [Liparis tanakae]|uniref:Uncharacterized protein n=1 Tax=Liparis tanakae TaxID=230148 RepID=A0A4Z2GHT3_9TELE|nr:hypothetical protein EYF80_037105 [Liparis tanakae]